MINIHFLNWQTCGMLISILNSNDELANIPFDVHLRVRVPDGFKPFRIVQLPDLEVLEHNIRNGYVETQVNDVKIFTMLGIEYR